MKKALRFVLVAVCFLPFLSPAQQSVTVISRCGGLDTLTIPAIVDNDLDGMDDVLEQRLLNHFTPAFIQFDNESCPGPALDGTGDSNLVVCHIYPIPQQYSLSNSLDSVLTHPVAVVPKKGLITGLWWYETLIKVNAALLYGKDCGLAGHTSDVEGFNYSIKYIGPDTVAGWMYDTVLQHWMGGKIQTISHEGTLCEQIETYPYRSALFPAGKDTILASPDKHGNYLTTGGCGASFICNPGCGGIPAAKNVRPVNIGEPNASLIADLGSEYPAYAGNDPWSGTTFLGAQGGNAGDIPTKMILELTSDFIQGTRLTTQEQICEIYSRCFSTGSAYLDYSCNNTVYPFYDQELTTSGTYYHTLTSSYGCDSTIAITLSVLPTSTYSYSASICDGGAYDFNGMQLSAAGVYTDTLTNLNGCDSAVILQLEVKPVSEYFYTASACHDETYLFNGVPLATSGEYVDTLSNINGCDSVVHLSLTIDTLIPLSWNFNGDTLLTSNHVVFLTGASPMGGTFSGPGVRGNLFYPDSAGAGTHVLTYTYADSYGCGGTVADTVTILATGVNDLSSENFLLYPNPAHNVVYIFCPQSGSNTLVHLWDSKGAEVKTMPITGKTIALDVSLLPQGLYTLQVTGAGQNSVRRLAID